MNKPSKLFFLILLAICLILPLPVMGINQAIASQEAEVTSYTALNETMDLCAVKLAMDLDPSYEPLQISETVPENVAAEIQSDFNAYLNSQTSGILKNEALSYRAAYKQNILEHGFEQEQDSTDAFYWYDILVRFNKSVQLEGSNGVVDLNQILVSMAGYEYYARGYDEEGAEMPEYLGHISSLATLSLPAGLSVQFEIQDIPVSLSAENSLARFFTFDHGLREYPLIICALAFGLFFLIILFVPYRLEKEAWVFRDVLGFNALAALFIGTVGMTGVLSLNAVLGYGVFSASLIRELKQVHIPLAALFAYLSCYILWVVTFFFFALAAFYIKSIFCRGLLNYLKEDTIFYPLCRWGKNIFHELTAIDLSQPAQAQLARICGLAGGIMVLIMLMGRIFGFTFGLICCILAAVYLFSWLKRRSHEFVAHFQQTLEAAHLLGQGKFKEIRPARTGIMQPVYDQLMNIRSGFEKAIEEAIASQNMKTQLLSNVSHDLKTPLTGIKNYSELIETTQDPQEIRLYASKLNSYCDRLDRLIVDLFDVSKADSGSIKPDYMEINLNSLIEEIQIEHEEKLSSKRLAVVKDLPEEEIRLILDPNRTMRIFDNLFSNMEKYALDGTRIFIQASVLPSEVAVTLKNVSRFPLDFDPSKITARFERGDSSRHESGSGLGLAIVRSFMELQDGRFEILTDGDLFKAVLHFTRLPHIPRD